MPYLFLSEAMHPMDYQTYSFLPYPHNVAYLRKWLDCKVEKDPYYEVFVPFFYVRAEPHIKIQGHETHTTCPGWFVSNKGRVLSKVHSTNGVFIKPYVTDSNQLEIRYSVKRKRTYFRIARAVASIFVPTPVGVDSRFARIDYIDKNNHNLAYKNIIWEPMLPREEDDDKPVETFNMIEDLLDQNDLDWYDLLAYPHKTEYLNSKIQEQLEKDPDYEVFVPLVYPRLITNTSQYPDQRYFKPQDWHVSNKGRVLAKVRSKKGKIIRTYLQDGKYLEVKHNRDGVRTRMLLSRVVAGGFVPLGKGMHHHDARVGFKDNDLNNIHPSNLYWFD